MLEKYGGLWLDSTILVTEPLKKYKNFLNSSYFSRRCIEGKGRPISGWTNQDFGRWVSFIQGSNLIHHPLFSFAKEFFDEYWSTFNGLIEYLLIDFVIDVAYDNIPFVKNEIDNLKITNTKIFDIADHLNFPYEKYPYEKILVGNFFNKLGWKFPIDLQTPNTVFREIQKRYAPETIGQF